ncbi:MAG: Na(+)/H(+) antiporter subunit B [Syntrophaceae bacterium]|nr:Na(+)/H(+) antiporter subunit B [Syntrophaceae bacterium]
MNSKKEEENVVIETASRIMIPFIQLFALYVITHGALGPGGGFQGGVVFASSYFLYIVVFNIIEGKKRLPESVYTTLSSTGLCIYAGVGLLSIILSFGMAQYLNYGFIPFTSHFEKNRSLGIDLVEIGVGITVMAVMVSIFFDLAGKEKKDKGE